MTVTMIMVVTTVLCRAKGVDGLCAQALCPIIDPSPLPIRTGDTAGDRAWSSRSAARHQSLEVAKGARAVRVRHWVPVHVRLGGEADMVCRALLVMLMLPVLWMMVLLLLLLLRQIMMLSRLRRVAKERRGRSGAC